jgi:predicted RNase H-like nuclease (RuvC/YqgF family)
MDSDESLRRTIADQEQHIQALRERVEFLSARERELETALAELRNHDERDRSQLGAAVQERDARLIVLEDELRAANRTIRMMQSTRVWDLGRRYWEARDAVKSLLRRA